MRAWIKSACVVLAWSILPIILVAAGMTGSVHPAQANTRTASSTEVTLTSTLSIAAAPVTATTHTTRYVVHNGDTLSGIAAGSAVRGGWPALYAANRKAIGPDPDLIHSGTVLVLPGRRVPVRYTVAASDTLSGIAAEFAVRGGWPALYAANRRAIGPDPDIIHAGTVLVLPGRKAPVRYTVAAGDTLSGIAAEFAVRGGWPALYAANRRAIGSDPNVIHAGTVLTFPHPAAPAPPTPGRAHRRYHRPAPPPSPPAGPRHHPLPVTQGAPAPAGMPQWLKTMLLAVGLLILAAFLAEPVLVVRRRRQQAAARQAEVQALGTGTAGSGHEPASRRPGAGKAQIIPADHHRLAVTCDPRGDTGYVL